MFIFLGDPWLVLLEALLGPVAGFCLLGIVEMVWD